MAGYLGSDFPIESPVGVVPTVEMTFQEASRFSLSDNDTRSNWKTLLTNQFGTGFHHIGPYHFRFISGAYHSLHCVYNAQLAFDRPHHREHPDRHLAHCLLYMQQLFLCNADMALEEGDFMARNITIDRVGTTRRCRDWSTVAAWVNKNSREWIKYNAVDLEI
jgi:Mycotoxin biosynthesis protein UstYa